MEIDSEFEVDTPLLTAKQVGEECNAVFGPFYDEDGAEDSSKKSSRNHGVIDHLQAFPYPFDAPPRAKNFTRPIEFGDDSE